MARVRAEAAPLPLQAVLGEEPVEMAREHAFPSRVIFNSIESLRNSSRTIENIAPDLAALDSRFIRRHRFTCPAVLPGDGTGRLPHYKPVAPHPGASLADGSCAGASTTPRARGV